MDQKIEAKLDVFRKQQENITKVGFSIQHADIPDHLAAAALGKRYYIVLIDADYYDETEGKTDGHNVRAPESTGTVREQAAQSEKTQKKLYEGDKMRVRAVMLCKSDSDFQFFASQGSSLSLNTPDWEEYCRTYICNYCGITSRSELTTNRDAQGKFLELMDKFNGWEIEQRYGDILDREGN